MSNISISDEPSNLREAPPEIREFADEWAQQTLANFNAVAGPVLLDTLKHRLLTSYGRSDQDTAEFTNAATRMTRFRYDIVDKLQKSASTIMLKCGMRVPVDEMAVLDESSVPEDLAMEIKAGKVTLADLCKDPRAGNLVFECGYGENTDLELPASMMNPFSAHKINALLESERTGRMQKAQNTDMAMSIRAEDFWQYACNYKQKDAQGKRMVSLIAAFATLNNTARPKGAVDLKEAVYLVCPENCLGHPRSLESSGTLYKSAMQIAQSWNATVYASSGSPVEGTPAWTEIHKDMFTKEMVVTAASALGMLVKYRTEETEAEARVCFGHVQQSVVVRHPATAALYTHISTVHSSDEMRHRLDLSRQVKDMYAEEDKAVETDPKPKRRGMTDIKLVHPKEFQWYIPSKRPAHCVPEPAMRPAARISYAAGGGNARAATGGRAKGEGAKGAGSWRARR